MNRSIWFEDGGREFPSLREDIKCDVLIIGGGIAGVLCAYMMRQSGIDCTLIEQGRILHSVTRNTTAKITLQHGYIYHDIIRRYGRERAEMYYKAQLEAIDSYRALARKHPCDLETTDSYLYTTRDRAKIERETEALNTLGCKASFTQVELPFQTEGACRVKNQAQFDPLKLLIPLASELPIYEHTRAVELAPHGVRTERGLIKADSIVIATHFPILNKHGMYSLKLYQHRSYVTALEGAEDVGGMYMDENDKGISLRNHKNLLLVGGGGHRTGKSGGGWAELRKFKSTYYPAAREVAYWATQDCVSLDGIPYIGSYSSRTRGLYVATGFNKWGMTSSMVAAKILTDSLLGRENENAEVFSTGRSMLHFRLLSNAVETVTSLVTPTAPRCPHLGCALKYNAAEHSWDCPCHGSRFDEDGRLLEGPSTADKPSLGEN